MSTSYELTGRTRQKARTRAAMLGATRELLAEGVTPTVEQAAERASISRTTAYRYFPNQRSLLVAAVPMLDQEGLLGPDPPEDPEQRVQRVVRALTSQLLHDELQLRAMLRLSLDPQPVGPERLPLRRGRAIGWLEDALEPLRDQLSGKEVRELAIAIRAAVGIEPFVWLTDIAGVSRTQAVRIMERSAMAVFRDRLTEIADTA